MAKKKTTKKATAKAQGVGDTIEKVTKATGIKKAVTWLNGGEDCGECEERKRKLNRLFPYRKPNPLSEENYNFLKEVTESHYSDKGFYGSLTNKEQKKLIEVYNYTFNDRQQLSTCARCYVKYLTDLKKVVESYEK